jgi:hypothetical protein
VPEQQPVPKLENVLPFSFLSPVFVARVTRSAISALI